MSDCDCWLMVYAVVVGCVYTLHVVVQYVYTGLRKYSNCTGNVPVQDCVQFGGITKYL